MSPAPKREGYLLVNELRSMKWLATPLKIKSSLQGFTEALPPEQNESKRTDE